MASETKDKNEDSTGRIQSDPSSGDRDNNVEENVVTADAKTSIPEVEEIDLDTKKENIHIKPKDLDPVKETVIPGESSLSSNVSGQYSTNDKDTKSEPTSLPHIPTKSLELNRLHELCTRFVVDQSSQNLDDTSTKTTDSILQLLVTDDLSSIRDPEVLRSFFIDYLSHLPPKVVTEILSVLIAIVKKSVFHLESARGLLFSCLNYLLSDSPKTTDQLHGDSQPKQKTASDSSIGLTRHFVREWVNLLVAHSCDVEELKLILKLSEQDPTLLNFTQQANLKQRNRPHAFFAFPGTKGSLMSLPPFQKWPIQLGWSFSTWFFLEPKACAQPYLYNFKTGKSGLGFSAHFTGNCLVLTSIRVKGKGVQHCVAYEFPSYKWIHCAITYHNKWRASEIKVYVNGQLTANIEMPWQVQTTEMFDKCFIGGSGSITGNDRTGGGDVNCFCGQMSAIYLFNEGLSATQICALHRLGPSYMGQFKYVNESHVNLPPQISKTLYEEKFASSLFCLFTPVAVDSGTLCIQLAPFKSSTSVSAQNYFLSAPHAALQGRTKAIITQPICSTLQSIGCSRSLLPLLDVFASKGNADACASLIGFLCDLLESSPHWFANEIVQNNGFVVVACALASNARLLINERLLDIFLNLTRTLLTTSTTAGDSLLLKHLMDNILFNPSLWVYADTRLQIKLYNYLATEFLHGTRHGSNKYTISNSPRSAPYLAYNPSAAAGTVAANSLYNNHHNPSNATAAASNLPDDQSRVAAGGGGYYESSPVVADILFGEIRRVSTVLQSLHALKYYYWIAEEPSINHKARNYRLRPSQENLTLIRSHILSFTKELILRASSTPLDEIQGLLNYLSACTQPENLIDALDTLASLIIEHPTTLVAALDQKQAIRVLFTLIGSKSEQIRIKALRLLTLFLSQCSNKKKLDIMGPANLYMLLCDRLRAYRPLSLELYEALIDLLVEENNLDRKLDEHRPRELSKKRIENSMVVKVIASLLHEERSHKFKNHVSHDVDAEDDEQVDDDDHDDDASSDDESLGKQPTTNQAVDIRGIFINDLWNLIVNSRENRRIILQMSVWQHWLINLIQSTIDDSQLIRDQILAIFRVLLYHAIRYEYGGWRVWIDTLAIIHAKVSFDEFCQRLNKDSSSFSRATGSTSCGPHGSSGRSSRRKTKKNVTIGGAEHRDDSNRVDVEPGKQQEAGENESGHENSTNEEATAAKSQTIVRSISEHVPNESRGIDISSSNDQGYDEPDSKQEETSGNDDKANQIEPPVNSKEESKGNGHVQDEIKPEEASVDSPDLAPSRAFRKMSISENQQDNTVSNDDDNNPTETSNNQITRQQSLTSIQLEEPATVETHQEVNETQQGQDAEQHLEDQKQHEQQHIGTEQNHCNDSGEPQSLQSNNKATASPAFRIPEFKWTNILVKLLNDLMFSIECDLYHWRCRANMTSLDTPPFQPKIASLVAGGSGGASGASGGGQSSISSGSSSKGNAAAAAAAASSSGQLDSILQKAENQIYIINVVHLVSQLADNVIIAAGGLLPLLAEATGGSRGGGGSGSGGSSSDLKSITATCEGLSLAQANSLLYRLVNMVDMVVFAASHINLAELEADKNTTSGGILRQCLRLACTVTVKNCLVLRTLNSKISTMDMGGISLASCELPNDMFDSYQGCSLLSANGLFENSALTLNSTDLIADLEYSPHQTPNTSSMPSILPFQTNPIRDPNKLLQSIDIRRIQTCIYYDNSTESRQSQFLALSSLYFISVLMVSKYRDIIEPKHKSLSRGASGRSKASGGLGSSSNSFSSSPATSSQKADSSPVAGEPSANNQSTGGGGGGGSEGGGTAVSSIEANLLNFGKMQPNNPAPTASALTNMLTSRLENTLDTICPLLKCIMCDFCSFLSKTLIGSHGQDLVNKEAERTFRRVNASPVELVMLLCSQEWQNTLQKNAGLAFIELINEGRVLSHGMKDHIVRVAMEAEFILSRLRADDVAKHEQFGLVCSETLAARLHEEVLINSLISSAARRDYMSYGKFKEMVQNERRKNYKLDIWEDDDRRKRRFVFDSWHDSSQKFYTTPNQMDVPSKPRNADDTTTTATTATTTTTTTTGEQNAETSGGKSDDTSRILELQKTIERGGIDDHCSPTGTKTTAVPITGTNREPSESVVDGVGVMSQHENNNTHHHHHHHHHHQEDEEDEEEVEEEDDDEDDDEEEEDEDNHHNNRDESQEEEEEETYEDEIDGNTNSYASRQHHRGARRAGHNLKCNNNDHDTNHSSSSVHQQSKIHDAYQSAKMSTKEAQLLRDHNNDGASGDSSSKSNQAWDYQEDCGSVNDFTGSVIFAAECSLIWAIYAIPGVLQITTHELYFEPNQNIGDAIDAIKKAAQHDDHDDDDSDHNQSHDETHLRSIRSNHSESNQSATSEHISLRKVDLKALRYCDFLTGNAKFSLNDIRAIFSRHYLLQPNALELFLAQRTSVMFAFADFDLVKRVVKYLPPVGVGIKYGIQQSRRASLMSPRQLFAASNMTQKWQKREIGNFQYLMFLNTIAGRTYQDLNQYPVFPWILTNYESEELDLNLPTNFRDLSKPVGALNNKRRAEFIERYESWDNPKVPAFHYGTHYSTAAFTLNWLCRLRGAYNSSYLALQDGKYEEASRLFLSIGDSWVSSLIGGQQNVKELIPEFFHLPEMFHSQLGLPEVEYPPWAKSADQFVRVHRIALESELVSCQLHQWIDLIFGYKQRGPEAINSVNTFYYLTYQGNVNLNMIQDGSLRDAIETQIKHFGQTPSQLTTEPHPPRFSALHASPLMFSPSVDEVNKVIKFPFNNPVVHISSCINNYIAANQSTGAANSNNNNNSSGGGGYSTGTHNSSNDTQGPSSVLTITSNNQYQIHKWMSVGGGGGGGGGQSGHPFVIDPQLEGNNYANASNRRQLIDVDDICPTVAVKLANSSGYHETSSGSTNNNNNIGQQQNILDEVQLCCTHYIVTLNGKYIIMGSFYDNSFRVFTTESGKLCQVIYGHRGPITCLARSEGNAGADFYLATGSQDCSLLIWTWNERYAQVEGSGVSAVHNPLPKLSICGHHTSVLSASICAELGLIISGSKNLILVHTTTSGENLLQIDLNLPDIMDRTLNESRLLHTADQAGSTIFSQIQRPQVEDKQKTILEASMLGEDTRKRHQEPSSTPATSATVASAAASEKSATCSRSQSPNSLMKDEKFSQLRSLCCSDYYVTNLQLARELGFIVCVALPPPRRKPKSNDLNQNQHLVYGAKSSPALLLTFNLKGSLMDSTPIGQSVSSPKLGDVCILQTSRDGEHLILNDSPITIKIYRTFGLQPLYAFNTNDIPNALAEDQNRIRSLVLLDQRYILVGLDNGKLIVYNSDFKSFN